MISKILLKELEKKAKPGITLTYTDLNNVHDKTTVNDPNNELAKAIKAGNIGEILVAIYKNTKFKGRLAVDKFKKLHIIDDNNKIHDLKVTTTPDTLTVLDPLNNKKTVLQHSKTKSVEKDAPSLQKQLLDSLKKRKMTDKEVIDLIKNFVK